MYSNRGHRAVALPMACWARPRLDSVLWAVACWGVTGVSSTTQHGFFRQQVEGGNATPNPLPQLGPGNPAHVARADEHPGGAGSTRGTARASAPWPLSKPRGSWQLSHPCPTPSQRQRILAMSKYPGSKWVDLPSTCNTTRDECRRDPRLAGPSQQQVELRHSTSPQVRPCAACMERNCVTSSASQPAQNCMCIFPKVSLNGLVSKKKSFPQYKTGKVHT